MSCSGRVFTGMGERSPVDRAFAVALALAFALAGVAFVRLTGRSTARVAAPVVPVPAPVLVDEATGAGDGDGGGGEDVRVTAARLGVIGAGGVSAATGGSGVGLMLPERRVVVGDCVVVPLVVVVAAARGV